MVTNYFGTALDDKGHFMWDILPDGTALTNRNLKLNSVPFDVEGLTNGYEKGRVQFIKTDPDYTVCCIDGSCIDNRAGSNSVFWVKEDITAEEFFKRMQATPVVIKILQKMPFDIHWPFDLKQ